MGPCSYIINVEGKELTLNEHEFKGYLLKGGFDTLIKEEKLKNINYASNVRSNEGQIPLAGDGSKGGQIEGSSNIQLPQEQTSGNGETEQQARTQEGDVAGEKISKMDSGIPPNMMDLPFMPEEGDVSRLAHADTEELYARLGMPDRAPRPTKDDVSLEGEADNLIRSGYDFEGKADRVISGRDKSFTDAEQVAFAKMVGALNVKLQNLQVNSPEFNSTYETIRRLSRASDMVGSEEGAAFRARRMFVLNDETLANFINTATEANLNVPLTEDQMAAVKAKFDDLTASRDAYRARLEKVAAENAKMKAEGAVKKAKTEAKASEKKTHEDYAKERKDIIAKMREDLLKVAKGGKGAMVSLPGAAQLSAIAPHVAKLVKSLAAEGVDKLEDFVKSIHDQLRDVLPGITEKNVHDIIAGEYSKKQTKSDLQEKVENIRIQAALINRLESLKAGVQPKGDRQKIVRTAEIEKLRQQIKDLTERPEKTEAEKLSALKARYKKQTYELQKKIDAGDFEPDERSELILDKEAQDLKDAYIKKKIEWQKAIAEDRFKNRSRYEQWGDFAMEVLGVPRTVMSSMDLSAPLRQGLVLTASHPLIAKKAFAESIEQLKSPERFDRWLYDLKESDYYKNVIEKSDVYIADPNNLKLSAQEEVYMSNVAEKIPVLGKGIAGSERAYVAYLNKLRVDVFTLYATNLSERGITIDNRPDVYKALGKYINAATGRGNLPEFLERSAPVLNSIFFSPRLIASRLNLLNPVFYAKLPKEIRIMALKDMGKTIGLGIVTLGLFSLIPGVTVEKDPRSTDFGKIKAGDTRWDIWGGFQQYIRLASQLMLWSEKRQGGDVVPLGNARGQHTAGEQFLKLWRGKLSPIPSIVTDYAFGKTAVGEDVELTSEAKEHLLPMIFNDVADAWKEQGPMSMVYTGIPSFFGVGTTTYKEKERGSGGKNKKASSKSNKKTKK